MNPTRRAKGIQARRRGRRVEIFCALWLMAKGYRLLGFRVRTPLGEIDILAKRGDVLAVIEVKQRRTLEQALTAISWKQKQRLLRAGAAVAAKSTQLSGLAIRLDLMALAPGRWPRHIRDAWRDE